MRKAHEIPILNKGKYKVSVIIRIMASLCWFVNKLMITVTIPWQLLREKQEI